MDPQLLEADSYYWLHHAIVCFIWALLFFIVGLLLGSLLWRRSRDKAQQLAAENEELRHKFIQLRDASS